MGYCRAVVDNTVGNHEVSSLRGVITVPHDRSLFATLTSSGSDRRASEQMARCRGRGATLQSGYGKSTVGLEQGVQFSRVDIHRHCRIHCSYSIDHVLTIP